MFFTSLLRSTNGSSNNRRAKARASRRTSGAAHHTSARRGIEALEPRAMLAAFQGLGGLAGGVASSASDISDDGQVVVGNSGGQAFSWTRAGGMVGLGAGFAYGVSADGSVIVGTSYASGQSFRWTQEGGMVGLGSLPSPLANVNAARAVSADGSVIVGLAAGNDLANPFVPYIWDAGHGMRDFRSVLVNDYGLGSALTGWTLAGVYGATGISADGRVIVGTGRNPLGAYEWWIADLTPTDPGAPTVDAGANQTILVNATAALDGTVADDGLPAPLTTTWSLVSGPGTVTFGNAAAVDTTAKFSTTGMYELKLQAFDGSNTTSDYVYFVVNPVTASLTSVADTYIAGSSGSTSKNFGTATSMTVSGSPDDAALLRWDLSGIPAGSTVQSASLSVNVTGTSANTYEICQLTRSWAETQATWSKAASGNNWQTAGAQGSSDRGSTVLGTITASATGTSTVVLNAAGLAVVQGWVNNPSTNYGFILQDYANTTKDDLVFSSREDLVATNRPRLVVSYDPLPPAPASLAVAAANETASGQPAETPQPSPTSQPPRHDQPASAPRSARERRSAAAERGGGRRDHGSLWPPALTPESASLILSILRIISSLTVSTEPFSDLIDFSRYQP